MAHHAYTVFDEADAGILRALTHAQGSEAIVLRYGLFSVDDARELADIAVRAPTTADTKVVIVSATRFFHEAQNALLKLFEEPPAGTTLILILPSEGLLLPTLRSRLLPLPEEGEGQRISAAARAFLAGSDSEREKQIAKLLDRSKSDKDDEKQAARAEAVQLVEGMIAAARTLPDAAEVRAFQKDLHSFLPILHERSAPLKLIFEHLLLVLPKGLV